MRGVGALFIVAGAVLALIAGVWGRSGYYVSQAPVLGALAVGALICLGIGAGLLRYQKTSIVSAREAKDSFPERAFARPPTPAAVSASDSVPVPTLPASPPLLPEPPTDSSTPPIDVSIPDEITRDRPPRTTEWLLLLPDGTSLAIADALVVGRQPVSSDGGPTAAVPSAEVSKSHARFSIAGGELRVRDLDTTNGTVIVHHNDTEERASSVAEMVLVPGDRLEIGSYVLVVERRP